MKHILSLQFENGFDLSGFGGVGVTTSLQYFSHGFAIVFYDEIQREFSTGEGDEGVEAGQHILNMFFEKWWKNKNLQQKTQNVYPEGANFVFLFFHHFSKNNSNNTNYR